MIIKYILGGMFCGAIYGLLNAVVFVFKKHVVVRIICDLIFSAILGIVFLYLTMVLNLGQFRLYLIATFLLSVIIEQKTLGKLFAKLGLMVYNWVCKILNGFRKTKLGKVIFK